MSSAFDPDSSLIINYYIPKISNAAMKLKAGKFLRANDLDNFHGRQIRPLSILLIRRKRRRYMKTARE
jgi:hypothetical protein